MAIDFIKLALLFKLCSCFNVCRHFYKRYQVPFKRYYSNTLESSPSDVATDYATFKGNKVIIDNSNLHKYESSISDLLDTNVLGFDLEYAPDFYSNFDPSTKKFRPATVQICADSTCFIYLIYKIGHIPNSLISILDSKELLKVSHGAPSDMRLLFRHFGIQSSNFVDLQDICTENKIFPASLKRATESVLKLNLSKKHQCSNWEAHTLSPEQITYASTDAWVTREIFLKLPSSNLRKLFVNDKGDIETQ